MSSSPPNGRGPAEEPGPEQGDPAQSPPGPPGTPPYGPPPHGAQPYGPPQPPGQPYGPPPHGAPPPGQHQGQPHQPYGPPQGPPCGQPPPYGQPPPPGYGGPPPGQFPGPPGPGWGYPPPPPPSGRSNKAKFWIGAGLSIPAFIALGFVAGAIQGVASSFGRTSGDLTGVVIALLGITALVLGLVFDKTRWYTVGALAAIGALLILTAGACIVLVAALVGGLSGPG